MKHAIFALAALATLAALSGGEAVAQDAAPRQVNIGFLSMENDPRYAAGISYARIQLFPGGEAVEGARLGLVDTQMISEASGLAVALDERRAADADALAEAAVSMAANGAGFIILDLPGQEAAAVAERTRDLGVTLINATAPDDALRSACFPHMVHTAASDRMLSDALAQHLRARNWQRVLVLVGEEPRDAMIADSFVTSAGRLGLRIAARKTFTLDASPERREENNIDLLTGGHDYDVVFIADSLGEFSRYVPYATRLPRPVIGATGLTATEWHWSLERYGAPQVNSRFEQQAGGARMTGQDFATWMAVKAVVSAYARARSEEPAEIAAYLRSARARLDGSKGVQMSFREWDGQLRQPIILATHNAVIAIAPLEGFKHQFNELDTLGTDQPEFRCD